MKNIYVFSGPCGCGKTTLADAYARHLVTASDKLQVYVIHGDDFHKGFAETDQRVASSCPGFLYWADILTFNWECILNTARSALTRGLDVIIDYVVEDELPQLKELARANQARIYYVVLTASQKELRQRLIGRGSSSLIERSLFLKSKLEALPENQRHLYSTSGKTPEQEIEELAISGYEIIL